MDKSLRITHAIIRILSLSERLRELEESPGPAAHEIFSIKLDIENQQVLLNELLKQLVLTN
jgi:hypothetical protein